MTENTDIVEENETVEETPLDDLSRVYDELVAKAENTEETQTEGIARDERGRFAAKEQATVQDDSQETVEKPKIDLNQLGYNKAEQEKLAALPEDVLNVLVERNNRYHSGLQPLKQKAEIADSFIGAITPHAEYLRALQVAPEDFISSMLSTEKMLRLGNVEQKINTLQKLAHEYQIPLEKISEQPFDANLAKMQQELEYRDRQIMNMQRARQSEEDSQAVNYVSQWAQGKEHLDVLREPMAALLNNGLATDLDDAYNKALRLNDELYGQQQKKQQALIADQKARRALNSSVQVRNNATTGQNMPVFATPLDELRYKAEQMGF